eukprot:2159651-Pyramimonas_sp.AAC.1
MHQPAQLPRHDIAGQSGIARRLHGQHPGAQQSVRHPGRLCKMGGRADAARAEAAHVRQEKRCRLRILSDRRCGELLRLERVSRN